MGFLRLTRDGVTLAEIPVTRESVTAPASLYLSPSGNDSNPGTQAAPLRTFGRAHTLSPSGGVVSVGPGVYPVQNFGGVWSGTSSKPVTFRGEPGNVVRGIASGSSNLTYDGIVINCNAVPRQQGFTNYGGTGVVFKNGSIGNVIDEKAALVERNIVFDNVRIHDVQIATAGTHLEGIYAHNASGIQIRNCVFENCDVFDVFLTVGSQGGIWHGGSIIGNTFWGPSLAVATHDPLMNGTSGWTIQGNHFGVANRMALGGTNFICGNTGACPASWQAPC